MESSHMATIFMGFVWWFFFSGILFTRIQQAGWISTPSTGLLTRLLCWTASPHSSTTASTLPSSWQLTVVSTFLNSNKCVLFSSKYIFQFSQFISVTQSCPTLCDPMNLSTPGLPVRHQLLEFTQTLVHWVGDAIQPSHPLSSPSPPAPNPSQHQSFFSNESTLRMRWPKYWSFSFSIIPSKVIPGLISFRMDWLDLLAVQGTLKSLLQHYSSKASILRCSAFFTVQLSHPYMTTGKTIALTRRTFVSKVMSLLLNMLSRLVITFLPRSKRLLISWLQSPTAVILETKK